MNTSSELPVGLSVAELEALADKSSGAGREHRLDELIERSKEKKLTSSEECVLDGLSCWIRSIN